MQIQLVAGTTTDEAANFRRSLPLNLIPVPMKTEISNGYLRTADGMIEFANSISSVGSDRGAINWNGICYRVIGDFLTRVNEDGTIDYLGALANDSRRSIIVNSFDRLAIVSAGQLYYWSPTLPLTPVTDPDLGIALDVVWLAGYFVTTDGTSIVVTDLTDPFSVNPLKYGSSEVSPDPVNSLLVIRNELLAVNRFTIEFFQNVAGTLFPFQRIDGAMIPKGSVGTHASCYFLESFAFVGGGANESISVYIGAPGQAVKIASREVETQLEEYDEEQIANIVIEARTDKTQQFLYVHLPDKSLVYDAMASALLEEPVWHTLASGSNADMPYRARNFVRCYGKWLFGDLQSTKIGYYTQRDAREFGATVPWQFDTALVFNETAGVVFDSMELVRLPGRDAINPLLPPVTVEATVFLSYTLDGLQWSNPRSSLRTRPGMVMARTAWRRLGKMALWRGMRFRGMNNPYPDAFARLDARVEPLDT